MNNDTCDLLRLDLSNAKAVRASLPDAGELQSASTAAQSLFDPTRLSMAALTHATEACVCDFASITGRAQNLVSHHLRTLRPAGLVMSTTQGKMVVYSPMPSARKLLKAVLTRLSAPRRRGGLARCR